MVGGRILAETVFATDPKTHQTLLLTAGTEVTDQGVAEQITHPDAWAPTPVKTAEGKPSRPTRRTKSDSDEPAAP